MPAVPTSGKTPGRVYGLELPQQGRLRDAPRFALLHLVQVAEIHYTFI
jgi:hypothetical protein